MFASFSQCEDFGLFLTLVVTLAALVVDQQQGGTLYRQFFDTEYAVNHMIGTYKKPYVAILNGITSTHLLLLRALARFNDF